MCMFSLLHVVETNDLSKLHLSFVISNNGGLL